jgi:hypothetical protein
MRTISLTSRDAAQVLRPYRRHNQVVTGGRASVLSLSSLVLVVWRCRVVAAPG